MLTVKNMIVFGSVIVIAVVLQVILILVGKVDSPAEAAVDFTKAYFMLDGASMSERLCAEIVEDKEADIVDEYLNRVADQARSMGFSQSYMRNQLSHVNTEIQMADEKSARVRITGKRLRSINPVFAIIGKLFSLIESHQVDVTLTLVKEDDQWKVCSKPFLLSEI
jgi:uncharacterized membrane protein YvbJ